MRKVFAFEVVIIILTLAIAIPLLLSIPAPVIERHQDLLAGQRQILFFDLQSGQIVTGNFYFSGGTGRTGFNIDSPNHTEVYFSFTSGHEGTFKFRADIPGEYRLLVANEDLAAHYVKYEYTISSPILGFDPVVLIVIIIAVSIVLTLVNIFLNWRLIHNRPEGKPTQLIR